MPCLNRDFLLISFFKNNYKTKKPNLAIRLFQKKGDDILSHITAVPSAQAGLTTLFGMGRGEPRRNNHLKSLVALDNLLTYNSQLWTDSCKLILLTHWDKEIEQLN